MRYAAPIQFTSEIKLHALPTRAKAIAATLATLFFTAATLSLPATAQTAGTYTVTNLVSDGSVTATVTDPNFINPWAISASSTWWIPAEGTGFAYAVQTTPAIPFKVIVPAFSGLTTAIGQPTGSVSTAAATGMVLPNGTKANFLFSTLDGTISGWNPPLGTVGPPTPVSLIVVNNHAAGAVYTGMAIINNTAGSFLVVPNFGTANKIEVYDSTFKPATLSGGTFTDPTLPTTYSPYGVHLIGSQVYVTYAVRSGTAPFTPVSGIGNGIVSVFDTTGKFISRIVTGGNLNVPWGVAIAPANFGIFSNDILIGNFGNGLINVYNPTTFAYLGQLADGTGKPLTYATLWELLPAGTFTGSGNTTSFSGGTAGTVYFTAGLAGQAHGLLGGISSSSVTVGPGAFGFSTGTGSVTVTNGNSTQVPISVAPANNFSGSVALACSGLPLNATCAFSPSPLAVTANAPAVGTVTIQTAKQQGTSRLRDLLHRKSTAGITYALLLPFASILIFRRRRSFGNAANPLRLLGVLIFLVASTGFLVGCLSSNNPSVTNGTLVAPGTPSGTTTVTITATSGSISQTATVSLIVQ